MIHRRSVPVVAVFLFPFLLAAPALARPLKASDAAKLEKAARHYVHEADASKRGRLYKPVASLAKKLSFEEVEALVARVVPGDTWKKGFTHDVSFKALGETWTYSVHLPKKRPKGLVPLVVDPGHGSLKDAEADGIEDVMGTWLDVSGARDDVIYLRTRVIDGLSKDGRYDAWTTPPRRAADKENMDTVATLLLAAVRDASLRYPVDPNRVYVHGISQTGFWAWWLGTFAPGRFAAVVPVSSVTWHVRGLLQNLTTTPVFVLHGTADPTCPFAQAKASVDALKALGAPVTFLDVPGGEHVKGVFPRWKDLWPDVSQVTRNPFPERFERRIVSPARGDAFWLRARDIEDAEFNPWGPATRLVGRIEGQKVVVETEGCKGLTLLLATSMLDLTKKVEVEINGKRVYQRKPKPTPREVLDLARERGDGAPFSVVLEFEVP